MSAYEALKTEIRRLARKEAKSLADGSTKSLRVLRKQVADLRNQVSGLKSDLAAAQRALAKLSKSAEPSSESATGRQRISAKGIVALRSRLGLSQHDLGLLCGVGSAAVSHWEAERSHPKADALATLISLRSAGKKNVAKMLAAHQA